MKNFQDAFRRPPGAQPQSDASPFPRIDLGGISETIENALAAAGLPTAAGPMRDVTQTIRQALDAAGLTQHGPPTASRGATTGTFSKDLASTLEGTNDDAYDLPPSSARGRSGEFIDCAYRNAAGARTYKLYIPAGYSEAPDQSLPLVVMLHGCTQSPDDFAIGTRMNVLADEFGFLVAYPAQAANANGSKCWNWFRSGDQSRDAGEPSLIAGITREVAETYRVDTRRIFVAGMSAGGAMAVILGETYPELYAAVGVHSGLPFGAAHDMPSAFGAMRSGPAPAGVSNRSARRAKPDGASPDVVPTIVFHGNADSTVAPANGVAIIDEVVARSSGSVLEHEVGYAPTGGNDRTSRRIQYFDATSRCIAERWDLHGTGHAWSGGDPAGSFTDRRGPDASREMLRFFLSRNDPASTVDASPMTDDGAADRSP